MQRFHEEILIKEQVELLPVIAEFSKDFGLVGGTAIALHLGHRRSIDFDLFSSARFGNQQLLNKLSSHVKVDRIIVNKLGELTLLVKGVKITFFNFPYQINFAEKFHGVLKMPNLLALSAMKAFALGMRAKWKDYIDLYFILKDYFTVSEISQQGKKIFGNEFNEKLFRTQLGYFVDIDYAEKVEFLKGLEVSDKIIKKKLIDFATQ